MAQQFTKGGVLSQTKVTERNRHIDHIRSAISSPYSSNHIYSGMLLPSSLAAGCELLHMEVTIQQVSEVR